MARPKKKDGVRVTIYISKNNLRLIKNITPNVSAYIEALINKKWQDQEKTVVPELNHLA